jgi:hypothetical protein
MSNLTTKEACELIAAYHSVRRLSILRFGNLVSHKAAELVEPYRVRNPTASDKKWPSILDGRSRRQTYSKVKITPLAPTAIR